MSNRVCAHCSGPIESDNPRATYCRRKCKESARQKRRNQQRKDERLASMLTCEDCGEQFPANESGPKRKRCSACNGSYIDCALCGRRCRPNPGEIHCVKCRIELRELSGDEPLEQVDECETCGSPFVQGSRKRSFCSDACARTSYRYHNRSTWHMRRASECGAEAEKFLSVEIFERDEWTCKLCGIPVNRETELPHPFAPTLDHVIPLVQGGQHTRDNTQCAHFYCNSIKSDAADPEGRLGVRMPDLD